MHKSPHSAGTTVLPHFKPQIEPTVADYRWLIEGPGQKWLELAMNSELPLSGAAKRLRRDLTAMQTHLVLEQKRLRLRARPKFADADRMYFTPKSLEQSTAAPVADHKASRFPPGQPLADLCCGMGGDLMALAAHRPTTGVERNEVLALLAQANCRALGRTATVKLQDMHEFALDGFSSIHIDPDRRPDGRKSIRLENHQPARSTLEALIPAVDNLAIKLAPATEIDEMLSAAELEWIGWRRECQQLVAWYGQLARRSAARRATIVTAAGPQSLIGHQIQLTHTTEVDRFLIEPHAAVLAAHLAGQLADDHRLQALTPQGGYLTGSAALDSPMAASYEVTDVLAYRPKRVKAILRQRQIGNLVVKQRGVPHTPAQIQRDCLPTAFGDGQAVLILTTIGQRVTAVLAQGR
jgi:hypothetical protein